MAYEHLVANTSHLRSMKPVKHFIDRFEQAGRAVKGSRMPWEDSRG